MKNSYPENKLFLASGCVYSIFKGRDNIWFWILTFKVKNFHSFHRMSYMIVVCLDFTQGTRKVFRLKINYFMYCKSSYNCINSKSDLQQCESEASNSELLFVS